MPLIYEDENHSREDLDKLRRVNKCKDCGANLNVYLDVESGKAFLACWDWHRTHHQSGYEREAGPPFEPNLATRREEMDQEYGKGKADAVAKYFGQTSLQKVELQDIIETLWPEAPDIEKTKAIMLCATYGLNPLNKHIFLIPFNKGEPDETWALVMSIHCKRLLASRRGPFSYVDNTPRVMTNDEQQKVFGEVLNDRLYVITKLRDPKTTAESVGYGFWFNKDKPKGENKGNTRFNMAAIRSESQALDRLRPGEMPLGVEAVEESAIEGEYSLIAEGAGIKTVPEEATGESRTGAGVIPATKGETSKIASAPPAEPEEVTEDRSRIQGSIKRIGWNQPKVTAYVQDRCKDKSITSIEKIPADKVRKIAMELADWEVMA